MHPALLSGVDRVHTLHDMLRWGTPLLMDNGTLRWCVGGAKRVLYPVIHGGRVSWARTFDPSIHLRARARYSIRSCLFS